MLISGAGVKSSRFPGRPRNFRDSTACSLASPGTRCDTPPCRRPACTRASRASEKAGPRRERRAIGLHIVWDRERQFGKFIAGDIRVRGSRAARRRPRRAELAVGPLEIRLSLAIHFYACSPNGHPVRTSRSMHSSRWVRRPRARRATMYSRVPPACAIINFHPICREARARVGFLWYAREA